MELSLCMIVKNEERLLPRCLDCVGRAMDEIIIVDTGSGDATKEIAGRYTAHVYDFEWEDDFAAARNAALDYASKPYVIWLDADDWMTADAVDQLIELKARLDGQIDAVMMPYHCGIRADGTPSLVFDRERILRREAGFRFEGRVHEAISVHGRVIREMIPILHMDSGKARVPGRNLAIYERALAQGEKLSARDWYYYAREIRDSGDMERAEKAFARFLCMHSWLENRLDAHVQRGRCLQALGRSMEARIEVLSAMAHGEPRGEALCAMGDIMLAAQDYGAAAFWYEAALRAAMPCRSGAFVQPDAYGYIPAMQLCVCYDRMGRVKEAAEMNERALTFHPDDPAAKQNRIYFASKV